MDGWHDFLVVEAGAAAALAGFVFVGLSLNLERLLKYPAVLLRAAAALIMLLNVLVSSSLALAPGLSSRTIGVQLLLTGGLAWLAVTFLSARNVRATDGQYRKYALVLSLLRQLAMLPAVIGGLLLTLDRESGMYWLVPAFTLTFVVALAESWVILVEIDR